MGSGCGDSIVDKILRPPGNSPSRWHLTRRLLLCSRITIHDIAENVNSYFIDITRSIRNDGLFQRNCRIFLRGCPPFSLSFLYLSYYNGTT